MMISLIGLTAFDWLANDRDLNADPLTKDRCFKKCSDQEIASIQAVLEQMQTKEEVFPAIPQSWTAGSSNAAASSEDLPPVQDVPDQPKTSLDIFKRVLERKVSEASSAASPQQIVSQVSNPFVIHGGMYSKDEVSLLEDVFELNNKEANELPKKMPKKTKQLPSAASSSNASKAPMQKKSGKKKSAGIKKTRSAKSPKLVAVKAKVQVKNNS